MGCMVVRFQCASCAQPIEVDDEWASKAVACPYCRKTVMAPAESTLGDLAAIPMASPLASGQTGVPPGTGTFNLPGGPRAFVAARPVNRLAVAALILAAGAISVLILANVFAAPHQAELEELERAIRPGQSFNETMQAYAAFAQAHPQAMQWLIPASLLVILAAISSIAGIICALIALRRPQRRGLAVGALVIACAVPVFLCCGGTLLGPTG